MIRTCCAVVLVCGVASAQSRSAEDDAAAIRQRTESFAKSLSTGDAKAVADHFTSGGEYVRDGKTIRGREALTNAYSTLFKEHEDGLHVEVESLDVRFPSRDTAVEEGRFASKAGVPSNFSILWVREDGAWRIAILRESANAPELSDLDWLLGSWEVERDGSKVRTNYEKVYDGAFLRMEYTVESDGGTTSGSQMIGHDPESGGLKSWLFNGDGGHGTGVWLRTGDGWRVLSVGRTADGGAMTAVNLLVPVDDDSFTFQATQRTIDGEPVPDGDVLTVKRAKASR